MTFQREEILAVVRRSPDLVAAHDKRAWLDLFLAGGTVEDPVGSAPARKGHGARGPGGEDDELARFWDVFIAPNDVRFEVRSDAVDGLAVARDVQIHTRTPNGAAVSLPAYLLYELEEQNGALGIRKMSAHWSLRYVTARALTGGARTALAMTALSLRMLRGQGPADFTRYLSGLARGIFDRGPRAAADLARAVSAGDRAGTEQLFASPEASIHMGHGREAVYPTGWLDALGAGAVLQLESPVACAWTTAARCVVRAGGRDERRGVAFLRFDPRSARIASARFVTERMG